jgi:hypothetical protein
MNNMHGLDHVDSLYNLHEVVKHGNRGKSCRKFMW